MAIACARLLFMLGFICTHLLHYSVVSCVCLFLIILFFLHFLSLNIQPFYMPLTWPIGHVSSGIMRDPNEKASSPTAAPDLDIVGKRENEENEN